MTMCMEMNGNPRPSDASQRRVQKPGKIDGSTRVARP